MGKRRSRRKSVTLARAAPSEKFLGQGPSENAIARARIAAAGDVVARSGSWPTLDRVERQDRKIAPATLGRNSGALDPARRIWMELAGTALVTAGEFPTLKAIQGRAGAVRLRDLARVEDALIGIRRAWVATHGPHPDWIDPADRVDPEPEAPGAAPPDGEGSVGADDAESTAGGPKSRSGTTKAGANVDTTLLQKRIDRLMAEKKKDRATIDRLTAELAESEERLRRAMLPIIREHGDLHRPAPRPAVPTPLHPKPKARPPK